MKETTIFLTGASGFIGSNLVKKLILNNNRIYALVRRPDKSLDEAVKTIKGDILNTENLSSVMEECEVVFHCAAHISFQRKDFQEAYQVNVQGTRNVLEAAYRAEIKKVVHLSACAVLGFSSDKDKILDETASPTIEKDNVYAYTKKLAEKEVQKYVWKGLDVSIANIATVYGKGDRKLNSGAVIKSIYEGKMKFIPPGGTSFVSVDDLVDGLILLAEKGRPGERYIFCTENMEYRDLVRRIARTLQAFEKGLSERGTKGSAPRKVKEPRYTLPGFTYYPALWAVKGMELFLLSREVNFLLSSQILKETYGYKYFSSEKAKRELGWKPLQSFEDALEKAFNYYKENRLI